MADDRKLERSIDDSNCWTRSKTKRADPVQDSRLIRSASLAQKRLKLLVNEDPVDRYNFFLASCNRDTMRKCTISSIASMLIFALAISILATGQELDFGDQESGGAKDEHSLSVEEVISYIEQLGSSNGKNQSLEKLDRIHSALTKVRAKIRGLKISVNRSPTQRVLDPFYLPKGVYRIHLEVNSIYGDSFLGVDVGVLTVNGEDTNQGLYVTEREESSEIFKSSGQKYMIEYDIKNMGGGSTADFDFWFEKLN